VFSVGLQLVAGEVIPPVLVVGFVFGTLAFLLKQGRRRVSAIGTGLAGLALAGNAPFIIEDLSHPNGGWVFALTLLSLLAGLAMILGGLGAFFGWSPTRISTIAVSFATVLAVGTMSSLLLAAAEPSEETAAGDTVVGAERIRFAPNEIVMAPGSPGVWVDNRDGIRHTFTIDELEINLELPANTARRVGLVAPPGEYAVYCDVPGHENMTATLIIED
jgi:plastocyanin